MKKNKKTLISLGFAFLGISSLHAQEGATAAGGEANGTGGTVSYSIGQILTETDSNLIGTVSPGIQQAYEIFLVTGINETSIRLKMNVYPNPTTDYLTLEVETEKRRRLTYQLYDLHGRLIVDQKVTEERTTVNMKELSKSTYLLNIMNNSQVVKSYKIVKQ